MPSEESKVRRFVKLPTAVVMELKHLAVQQQTTVDAQAIKVLAEMIELASPDALNRDVGYSSLEQLWLTMPSTLDLRIAKTAHSMEVAPARLILELLTKRFRVAQPV